MTSGAQFRTPGMIKVSTPAARFAEVKQLRSGSIHFDDSSSMASYTLALFPLGRIFTH